MSQAQYSEYESGEKHHQHSENAQFEAEFGLSWRDLEIGAKLKTAGTAVRQGAEKLEVFMEKVLKMTKVLGGAVVALAALAIVKVLAESEL